MAEFERLAFRPREGEGLLPPMLEERDALTAKLEEARIIRRVAIFDELRVFPGNIFPPRVGRPTFDSLPERVAGRRKVVAALSAVAYHASLIAEWADVAADEVDVEDRRQFEVETRIHRELAVKAVLTFGSLDELRAAVPGMSRQSRAQTLAVFPWLEPGHTTTLADLLPTKPARLPAEDRAVATLEAAGLAGVRLEHHPADVRRAIMALHAQGRVKVTKRTSSRGGRPAPYYHLPDPHGHVSDEE